MNPKSALGRLAIKSLMKNDQDMTYEKAEQQVQRKSYDEIARKSNCLVSLSVASTSYALDFGLSEQERQEFLDECLGRKSTTNVTDCLTQIVSSPFFPRYRMIDVMISATSAVHDSWRYEQAADRFYEKAGKEYQYLPLPFIGVDEMVKDLKYVEAVQAQLDYPYQQFQAVHEFQMSSAKTIAYGMVVYGDLPTYISACMKDDPHLDPEIAKKFEDVEWIKETIVPQLIDKVFLHDDLMIHALRTFGITDQDLLIESPTNDAHNRDER